MHATGKLLIFVAFILLNGCAQGKVRDVTDPKAARSLPDIGTAVNVNWTDPAQFSEIRMSRDRFDAVRGDWVNKLATHLRQRASRQLSDGQKLEVLITDIDLAGEFEPERTRNFESVRMLRDIYPPRIDLSFKLYDAQGTLISEGERKLRDPSYLHQTTLLHRNDSLRYEKRLLDTWVRKEFR